MRPLGSPRQLEKRRRRAIQLLQKGKTLSAVAKRVRSSVSSVFRWQQAFRQKGGEGLNGKPAPGRPPKLSEEEKQRLVEILLKGPMAVGYPTDLWTTRRVAEVIRKTFGIQYHPNHIWRLLTGMDWSCQKPERRARERDEGEIAHWKRYHWPAIKKNYRTWRPSGVSG
jgi:transposase